MSQTAGQYLRELRGRRGLSLGALALKAGVSKAALSKWEAGLHQPRLPELEAVLEALHAPPRQRAELLARIAAPRAVRRLRELEDPQPPVGGDLLRALRLRRGWTQSQLASHLDVRQSALSRWERSEEWPTTDQLHALCYALGAHEEELTALTWGRFLLAGAGEETDPLEARRRRFEELWSAGEQRLLDLAFLSLAAALWPRAMQAEGARRELTTLYTRHAEWLALHRSRLPEAGAAGRRALRLIDRRARIDPHWFWAVHLVAKSAATGGRRRRPLHGYRVLEEWLPVTAAWPVYRHWYLHNIAEYLAEAADPATALVVSATACEFGIRHLPSESEHSRLSHARILLKAGRAQEALAYLPVMQGTAPLQQINDALTWAEALLAVDHRSAAHDWLIRAYTLIAAEELESLRPAVDALARQL